MGEVKKLIGGLRSSFKTPKGVLFYCPSAQAFRLNSDALCIRTLNEQERPIYGPPIDLAIKMYGK